MLHQRYIIIILVASVWFLAPCICDGRLLTSDTVKEKTINTEKKMTFKDGKWLEETVQTTTVIGQNGKPTTSQKASTKQIKGQMSPEIKVKTPPKITAPRKAAPLNNKPKTLLRTKDNQSEFALQLQKAINKKRLVHGAAPLKLNQKLSKSAKEWADRLAKQERMEHSGSKLIGENIYLRNSTEAWFQVKPEEVVNNWYKESKNHDYSKEPSPGILTSGHFSQMVWRDTTDLGVAFSRSTDGHLLFVVAYFSPKGNWIGEFKVQVLPIQSVGAAPIIRGYGAKSATKVDFNQEFLAAHNMYRKKHATPPLTLDPKLTKFAVAWAKKLAQRDIMEHVKDNKYGENLYMVWSSNPNHKPTPKEAVDSWYSEIKDYNLNKEQNDPKTGHFSQLVWKASKKLGVGQAKSKSGKTYIVAEYSPPGNFVTKYLENVAKPVA